MNNWVAFITVIISSMSGNSVQAATCNQMTHYYNAGNKAALCISTDLVAVPSEFSGPGSALDAKVSRAITVTGHKIIRADASIPDGVQTGVPVWFADDQDTPAILTRDIIVKFKDEKTSEQLRALADFSDSRKLRVPGHLYVLTFASPEIALKAANMLAVKESVQYAHPDFVMAKDFRRTDEFYHLQWHIKNTGQSGGTLGADLNLEPAFALTSGTENTIVAVLDRDFDIAHEDLKDGFYINSREIPGNQIDDDNNGYVDDVQGWSFNARAPVFNINRADHGTPVAGLVGARSNAIGTSGSCPNCTILPVAVSFRPSDDAEAIDFAVKSGATIITNSWGYELYSPVTDIVVDALEQAAVHGRDGRGVIVLFAMTNTPYDNCLPQSPDISSLPTVIAISSSDHNDKKIVNAGRGRCMDFLAPSDFNSSSGIVSTDVTGPKGYNRGSDPIISNLNYTSKFGGTSAATPSVAGVIGLMLSVNPALTRDEVMNILKHTSEKIDAQSAAYDVTGFSVTHGWGRINAGAAVAAAHSERNR